MWLCQVHDSLFQYIGSSTRISSTTSTIISSWLNDTLTRFESGHRYKFSKASKTLQKNLARTRGKLDFLKKFGENTKPFRLRAAEGNWTPDLDFGKVAFYHWTTAAFWDETYWLPSQIITPNSGSSPEWYFCYLTTSRLTVTSGHCPDEWDWAPWAC